MASHVSAAFASYSLDYNTLDQVIARAHSDALRLQEIAASQTEEANNPLEKKEQIEQCSKRLANLMIGIAGQMAVLKKIQAETPALSKTELIEKSLRAALRKGYKIFDQIFFAQVKKANKKFDTTVDKLNAFRTNPTKATLEETAANLQKLQNRATLLHSLKGRCLATLTPFEIQSLKELDSKIKRLQILIDPTFQKGPAPLFTKLAIICNQLPISPKETQEIKNLAEETISWLETQDQKSLDSWIYKLAPQPKSAHNQWGLLHRYDDLARFRRAFFKTILSPIEKFLQRDENGPQLNDTQMRAFWESLHRLAFGPQVDDPIAWAKSEFPSMSPLIKEALQQVAPDYYVSQKNENNDLPKSDLKDEITPIILQES